MQEKQNDFTKNSMAYNIMSLAIPMTIYYVSYSSY